MTRILHAALIVAASIPWAVACALLALALVFVLAADRLAPGARHGNCWSFCGPRWAKHGGYLLVRLADQPRVFGRRIIPHALWVHDLHPENGVMQTVPTRVERSIWKAWRTLYFGFDVRRTERPRNSRWADLDSE